MDVAVWLRSLGLERYEAAFRENEISERVLPSLTQEDLKEIGVGHVASIPLGMPYRQRSASCRSQGHNGKALERGAARYQVSALRRAL
jgi:hypothetical protein